MSSLFHALVMVGASASVVSCGGKASDDGRDPTEGTGGEENSHGTGGVGVPDGSGGSTMSPEPTDPEDAAQWACNYQSCSNEVFGETFVTGYLTEDESCQANPERPRRAEDCAADEWFECHRAFVDGEAVAVDCVCTPQSDDPNCSSCTRNWAPMPNSPICEGQTKLCICYPGILR